MQLEKKFRQVSAFTNRAETKLTPPLAVPSDLTAEQTVPSDSGFPPSRRGLAAFGGWERKVLAPDPGSKWQ